MSCYVGLIPHRVDGTDRFKSRLGQIQNKSSWVNFKLNSNKVKISLTMTDQVESNLCYTNINWVWIMLNQVRLDNFFLFHIKSKQIKSGWVHEKKFIIILIFTLFIYLCIVLGNVLTLIC